MEQLSAYQREDEIFSKVREPVQMKGDEEVMIGNYDSAPKLYGKLFNIGIRTSISLEDPGQVEVKGFGTTYVGSDPEKGDWDTIDNTLYADPEEWLDIKEKNADPDQWHPLI